MNVNHFLIFLILKFHVVAFANSDDVTHEALYRIECILFKNTFKITGTPNEDIIEHVFISDSTGFYNSK